MGPWRHSQVNYDGSSLGPFKWNGDTATSSRRDMLLPFFNQYLKDGARFRYAAGRYLQYRREPLGRFADWPLACAERLRQAADADLSGGQFRAVGFDKPAGGRRFLRVRSGQAGAASAAPGRLRRWRRWGDWLVRTSARRRAAPTC
jgi:predicted acyl esterase